MRHRLVLSRGAELCRRRRCEWQSGTQCNSVCTDRPSRQLLLLLLLLLLLMLLMLLLLLLLLLLLMARRCLGMVKHGGVRVMIVAFGAPHGSGRLRRRLEISVERTRCNAKR